MMLKKSIIKKCIIVLIIAVMSLQVGLMVRASQSYEFTYASFEEQYTLGESLNLPQVQLKIGDVNHSADSIVYLPNGEAYKSRSIILDQFGEYRVEYRKVVEAKLYSTSYKFTVIEKTSFRKILRYL